MRRAAIGDEQIIDGVEGDGRAQQTFDLVQKIRGNVRRYPDGWGEAAPLTGLLYCADCGGKMYVHRTNNGKRISQYTCSQYSKVPCGTLCKTQHRINEDVVLSLVSEMLKAIAEYAKYDRAEFVRVVQEVQSSQQTTEVKKQLTTIGYSLPCDASRQQRLRNSAHALLPPDRGLPGWKSCSLNIAPRLTKRHETAWS